MTAIQTLEQRKQLVEWMADRSVDTDIDSQERTYRKGLLDRLDKRHVHEVANKEGIALSNEHLGVIECLRDFFWRTEKLKKGATSRRCSMKYLPVTEAADFCGTCFQVVP